MIRQLQSAGVLLITVLMLLSAAGPGWAQGDVDLGVELRYRPETKRVVFLGADAAQQQFLRTRLTADFTGSQAVSVRLKAQDSRTLGVGGSGLPSGDENLGVHEAYMRYEGAFHPDLVFQGGRFEMKYGNERFIGPSNWSNTGARHDGFRFMWQNPAFQLDFFRTKIVERLLTDPSNSDHDLYGIYLQHQAMWDAFLLYDYDGRETITPDEKDLSRFTLGAYSAREFAGSFDYIANVAWQGGSAGNFDLSAYLLALELGWNAGGEHDWRAALGIDLASGDDPGDEDFQAYNNLYYTGHKFRGFMDQFLPSNPEGLLDLYLRGSFQPVPDWLAGADLHLFQFAQDPSTVNDERGVGSELDIFARVATMRNFSTEIGGSAFFPNEDTFGADADTELWGYLQFTATLP